MLCIKADFYFFWSSTSLFHLLNCDLIIQHEVESTPNLALSSANFISIQHLHLRSPSRTYFKLKEAQEAIHRCLHLFQLYFFKVYDFFLRDLQFYASVYCLSLLVGTGWLEHVGLVIHDKRWRNQEIYWINTGLSVLRVLYEMIDNLLCFVGLLFYFFQHLYTSMTFAWSALVFRLFLSLTVSFCFICCPL